MIEFLIGYACGIVTLIFFAALDARKKRPKKDRKTGIDRIIAYGEGARMPKQRENWTPKR